MTEQPERWKSQIAARYVIGEKLGEGATAEVWAARHAETGALVAVKVLRREVATEVGAKRFLREIEVARSLSHPGILPLLDAGEADGIPYEVMPLVAGETLRTRLTRERQLPLETALTIATQVAAALDAAHVGGVVHRDIKPENILLEGNRAFVADFGVAYAIDAAVGDRITASGLTVGTPQYMSPEQSAAERMVDGRSDLYSLACVVFEMLAGQPPFTGATAQAIRARHVSEQPPSIRVVRPSLPTGVDAALTRALAKAPADRPATATAFIEELRAPAAPRSQRARMWRRIGVFGAAAAAIVAVLIPTLSSRLPPARRWVLVADFAAPEGEKALGVAVRDLVNASLAQSSVISLVPSEQVVAARRRAQMPDTVALDLARAREIAYRTSVRAVVAGAINRLGEHAYSVTVHALDVDDGSTLVSDARAAADTGTALVRAVEELAGALRSRLGERAADLAARRPLEQSTTPDFEAYRLYHAALAQTRTGDNEGSLGLVRRAIARDSAFAAAWWLGAINHINSLRPDSAQPMYATALRFSTRFEPADLERLRADVALNVDHDPAAALRAYDVYLLQRPLAVGGHNNRGAMLSALGRHEEALRAVEFAMSIDPLYVGPRQIEVMNSSLELGVLGRLDSARAVWRRLTGAQADFVNLVLLSMEARWDSLGSAATEIARNAVAPRLARFPATTSEAAALAARRDTVGAESALTRAKAGAAGADLRWFINAHLLFDLARGARTRWALPSAFVKDATPAATFIRGLHAVASGNRLAAEKHAASLRALAPRMAAEVGLAERVLEALAAARGTDRERARRAAEALADSARFGEHQPFTQDRAHTFWLRLAVTEAFAAAGDTARALEFAGLLDTGIALPAVHIPLRGFVWRQATARLGEMRRGVAAAAVREQNSSP